MDTRQARRSSCSSSAERSGTTASKAYPTSSGPSRANARMTAPALRWNVSTRAEN